MTDEKYQAVVDETGSNRPQEQGFAFGVGALLFPCALRDQVVSASREIGEIVGKKDYKYREVQRSSEARRRFLRLFNAERRIRCYGFFTARSSVVEAEKRDDEAKEVYARYWDRSEEEDTSSVPVTERLLRTFVKYMAPSLIAHAVSNDYSLEVYWDDRNDFSVVESAWATQATFMASIPQYSTALKQVRLVGLATGEMNGIARLAGVVAGDLSAYFERHGHRIWPHLDASGLRSDEDPILISLAEKQPPPRVHTFDERLADLEPEKAQPGVPMIQGYYKAFLGSDPEGHPLISFGSSSGQYGLLRIEHGNKWHIHQLPD